MSNLKEQNTENSFQSHSSKGSNSESNVELQSEFLDPSLISATQNGDFEYIKNEFLKNKESILRKSEDGVTLLHWAAINNRLEICKFLISNGLSIDSAGGELDATPLHWVSRNGLIETASFLINLGADPCKSDKQGFNALLLATHSSNVLLVLYFIHCNVPVDSTDPSNRTSLHWAAYQGDHLTVDVLIKYHSDVHLVDNSGFTPLHWAAVRGNFSCIKKLIQKGSNILQKTNDGKSAIDIANELKSSNVFNKALIESGYSLNGYLKQHLLSKFNNNLIIFFYPFIILPIIIYLHSSLPFLLGPILALIALLLSIKVFYRFILPLSYDTQNVIKTPLLAGIFCATCFWVLINWVFFILPNLFMKKFALTHFFFISFFLIGLFYFFTAMNLDPGFVPKVSNMEDQKVIIDEMIEAQEFNLDKYCITCLIRKPIRAEHCYFCSRCVARQDHHCPWIFNCVGIRNHKPFLIFVIVLFIGIILFIYLSISYIISQKLPSTEAHCHIYPDPICTTFSGSPFSTWLLIFVIGQEIWVTFLVFVQLVQIFRGLTTAEALKFHKGTEASNHHRNHNNSNSTSNANLSSNRNTQGTPLDPDPEIPSTSQSLLSNQISSAQNNDSIQPNNFSHNYQNDHGSHHHHHSHDHNHSLKWRRCLKLLGIYQFMETARDVSEITTNGKNRNGRGYNPYDFGFRRNCADFWKPAGHGLLYTLLCLGSSPDGHAYANGESIDYYHIWKFSRFNNSSNRPFGSSSLQTRSQYELSSQDGGAYYV